MAIGVTVGLLALLGVGFGALAVGKTDSGLSAVGDLFSDEKIFREAQTLREADILNNNFQKATEPPISSSESSRPNNDSNGGNRRRKKILPLLAGMGLGATVASDDDTKGAFNWGLLFGVLGGAFVAYKVLKK